MNDFSRRVNSIMVKNLPTDFTTNQLDDLFSEFGRIVSSKVLPHNSSYQGGCGFVNFAEADSCNQAVERMDNFVIGEFTLRVSHSASRTGNNNLDRPQNGFRAFGDSNGRTMSATNTNPDESNGTPSPSTQSRFSGFRPASEQTSSVTQFKPMSMSSAHSSTSELDNNSNTTKPLWNSNSTQQAQVAPNSKSPFQNGTSNSSQQMTIQEHELFVTNKTYNIYLSNLEVPNVVFAATLDDYVDATLLITQMNKHEQLAKVQANSYKSKLSVGQACAALFSGDWYRARVLEVEETRVRVQYIDWGNTGWCDSMLEIRPLPNEYYKNPALCVKCILDGIPSNEKLSEEQKNTVLSILVLDLKLEMTVIRMENSIPHVRLNLGERNLNQEIRSIFPSLTIPKQSPVMNLDSNKPDINLNEHHYVQLTTVDAESECFHVLLMHDCLSTIMNVLKDWNASKQPLTGQPKANTLVCAQYDADDLWYRAWIESVTENGYRVYFVDFGNEEVVTGDRLSECPDALRNIPWQSVQIKLANIKLTDNERYMLLRDFETERFEMKIIQKHQNIYLVDLLNNGKSLVDHILELRKKEQPAPTTPIKNEVPRLPAGPMQQTLPKVPTPVPKAVTTESERDLPKRNDQNSRPTSQSSQPIVDVPKQPIVSSSSKMFQPTTPTSVPATTDAAKKPLFSSSDTATKPLSTPEQSNETTMNDNLTTLITEQRRQNRLLEQVLAAINTSNALLGQLVQPFYISFENESDYSSSLLIDDIEMSDKKDEIIVVGHRNPDTDAITAALVYAEFLRRTNFNAKAYRLGELNNETKFVLKTVGVEEPSMIPDNVPEGTQVALVDHNESQQSMENLKKMRVTHVVDHHKIGDLTTSDPLFLRFEPVGCTATILTKLFREHSLDIDQKIASLLISAILSDTLHFRSPTTTDDDRKIVEYLHPIAKIDDLNAYASKMFEAKSDLTGFSTKKILLLDYKTFHFMNEHWGVGSGETCNMDKMLERKDELLKEMDEEKKRSQLNGILFAIIDILNEKNLTLILGDHEDKVVREAFNVDIKDHIADLGPRISRKKQIIPTLEAYFNPKG